MARSQDEAAELHRRFMDNVDRGNDSANDDLVKESDPRDPHTVDGQVR